MQAIIEPIFEIPYLIGVLILGFLMFKMSKGKGYQAIFGVMAIVLAGGDSFHLVPRIYALMTDGLANHVEALGFGKFVTSITMTIFYLLIYHVWLIKYKNKYKSIVTIFVYMLAAMRMILCFFPQNQWLSADSPLIWGIYRNIPFLALGILIIYLYFKEAGQSKTDSFKWMWLAIVLSFTFYIPVVLWSDAVPLIGMLMLPKTCAYVWIVWMGFRDVKITCLRS